MPSPIRCRRHGFTLLELLVVVAIAMTFLGLLVPAVQKVRETAHQTICINNLHTIGVAIHSYVHSHRAFPSGGGDAERSGHPVPRSFASNGTPASGLHQDWGWMYQIVPYLDAKNLWALPPSEDGQVMATPVSVYFCPSRREPQVIKNNDATATFGSQAANDYAGNLGAFTVMEGNGSIYEAGINVPSFAGRSPFRNGLFVKGRFLAPSGHFTELDQALRPSDVADGLSYTILVSEKRLNRALLTGPQFGDQFGYTNGFGITTLRTGFLGPLPDSREQHAPTGDGFGSSHPSGVNMVFADGSVRHVRYNIAPHPVALPLYHDMMAQVGITPLPCPPHPPNSVPLTLFQRLCHRADGGVIAFTDLE